MHVLHGLAEPALYRGGFASIGNFDGVHRGHRNILSVVRRQADAAGVRAVVFTFDPHPITLLRPAEAPPVLTTLDRRLELIAACGIDCTIVYPTDLALLRLTPDEFFQQIVLGELHAAGLAEGPSFFYGRGRAGSVATLAHSCADAGLRFELVPPVTGPAGTLVSSSAIRQALAAGEIRDANQMFGGAYRLTGRVGPGAQRGRTLGFPTANLDGIATLIPPDGVYAGRAEVNGRTHPAAIHIGPNPTFAEGARKVEVHLLDFTGDLYGTWLSVDFLDRIRAVRKFGSREELVEQLQKDLAAVRELVPNVAP